MTTFIERRTTTNIPDRYVVTRALDNQARDVGSIHIVINGAGPYANAVVNLEQAQTLVANLQAAIEDATPPTPALIAKKISSLTERAYKAFGNVEQAKALDEIADLCQELENL